MVTFPSDPDNYSSEGLLAQTLSSDSVKLIVKADYDGLLNWAPEASKANVNSCP